MATPKMEENNTLGRQLSAANEEAWLSLGRIAEMMGDDENTMLAYEKVLSHNRLNATALFAIGCCYEKVEDYTKAADCFRGLVSLNEQNSDAWGHLGYCCLMMNDLTSAHTAYQYAMYNNPMSQKDPNMWYGIGQLYERLGSLEHAQESFEAVLRFEPNFNMALEVKFRLGIIAKQRGDYEGALERLKSVLHDVQANVQTTEMASDIWTQIGHVYELKDEIQLAKSSYLKVAELNPNNAKPLQQLGWLCLKHSEHPPAIDYLKKAVAIDPQDGKGWYLLGRCYMAVQEFEEAYDSYKHAVTTDSQNPNVWCSLGVLFYQLNQHLDALDAYSRAININPNICEVWYNVGTLYDTCNQTSDARDAYQKAAELGADAQFIRERLELLRVRETGQSTIGMAGANSAPGPSEPPTTSPMPTFSSRPTADTQYPAQQQGAPAQGAQPNGAPPVSQGAPMAHMLRAGEAPMSMSMGSAPTTNSMSVSGPETSSDMTRGLPVGSAGMNMMRGMGRSAPMNGGGMMPRGVMGGMVPGMQHPQQAQQMQSQHPQAQAHAQAQAQAHAHAQAQAQAAQAAQAHHHAQIQAQMQAQQQQHAQAVHMQQDGRRGMPGRPIKEENKVGGMRYAMDGGDRKLQAPPQRLAGLNPKNLGGPGGVPQGGRRDRFPIPMSDPKQHQHPSLQPPPGRR
ncbi:General transcriptional corepressor [Phytophthora cactorum]|nr:General transcriptional corepressor [Phytophthora cactorum]